MAPKNGRSSGLGSNTKKGAGPPSIGGSPDIDPSTIHATPLKDSSRRCPSANADWSPSPMYSHIRAGLTFRGRTQQEHAKHHPAGQAGIL